MTKIKENLKLCYRDITGKNGKFGFFFGWIFLIVLFIIMVFVYNISLIICSYEIGQIIMTILLYFVVLQWIIITLYKAYRKKDKKIENKEKK